MNTVASIGVLGEETPKTHDKLNIRIEGRSYKEYFARKKMHPEGHFV